MTTETNYRDFPRLTMNGDLLLVAHNAANSKADTDGDRPVLSAYHLPSLRQGSDDPPNWQYYSSDLNDAPRVFLVSHRGNTSGLSFVTDIRGDVTLRVAAFVPASEPHLAPAPIFASHDLGSAAPWPGPFMVFRSNTLHMAGQVQVAARVANQQPPRLSIRALRIPFATASPTTIMIDHGAVNDLIFGKNAPTDAAGDLVTYEVSDTAVNKHSDAIYVFGRTGIVTAQLLFPEVRYSVWAHSESKPRRSALLRAGDYQPQWFYDPPDPTSGPDPRRDGEDIHHARVPQDRLRDGGRRSGRRRDLLDHPRIRGQRRRLTRRSVLDRGRGARQRDVALSNSPERLSKTPLVRRSSA